MDDDRLLEARRTLVARTRWVDGHADVSGWFRDGALLALLGEAVAVLADRSRPTVVAGLESKGFVLGGLAARQLDLGLVMVRKRGSARQARRHAEVRTRPDWRGRRLWLEVDRHEVVDGDRVVLVDDWLETGAQAEGARALVEECGGTWAGVVTVVDDCADRTVADRLGLAALVPSAAISPAR